MFGSGGNNMMLLFLLLCCGGFGGTDMKDYFVATASLWMDDAALSKYPQSGGIFKTRVETEGRGDYFYILSK